MNQTKPEEQEKERMFKLKVMKKINKLKFVNGVESHFYYQLIHNDNKLTQFVFIFLCFLISQFVTFKKTEDFPSIRVDGQDCDSYELLKKYKWI